MINSQIAGLAPFLNNSPNLFNPTQPTQGGPPVAPPMQAPNLLAAGAPPAQGQGGGDGAGMGGIMKLLGTKDGGGSDALMGLLSMLGGL